MGRCFLSCQWPSPTQLSSKTPSLLHRRSWGCSSLLVGHNWLNCTAVRAGSAVLGSVIKHQRPPKYPPTHFWDLPPEDRKLLLFRRSTWVSPAEPQLLRLYQTLCFSGLLPIWCIRMLTITLTNGHLNCSNQVLLWDPWVVIYFYFHNFFPSFPLWMCLSDIFML